MNVPPTYSDERVRDFLAESQENLDQLDHDLLLLEKDPAAEEPLANVFRSIHTIKGTCGFFGFSRLEALTHAGEDLLSKLRDGEMPLDAEVTASLLALVDACRKMLASIEATRSEGDDDHSALCRDLVRLVREKREPRAAPAPAVPGDFPAGMQAAVAETSVRIGVELLDGLMNLVGELVLARNKILRLTAAQGDRSLIAASQRLSSITSELQEEVMKTRLQRIGGIWSKLPRMVRDLSLACGKEVRLEMEGEETELDRSIIEGIKAPLAHLIRNAIDHGIEAPAARLASGKPREGRLKLRAFHEDGQVNIEVSDDGAGIDPQKLREKALRSGFLPHGRTPSMDEEVLDLIFLPGFSTAERVTSISGRGVGMDVVKTAIEKMGGTIELRSRVGEGTSLKIKIPLTLAIIPALIVTSRSERFAIPLANLLELVRLEGEEARLKIERVRDIPMYRLRGKLLPLLFLAKELDLGPPAGREEEVVHIVVLQADGRSFGLVADTINDTEEIVVKPLGKRLKSLPVFAGGTIMGDGKVALILDGAHLARMAHVSMRDVGSARTEAPGADSGKKSAGKALLLFRAAGGRRMAIPVSGIARLEDFPRSAVESAGGRPVIQYRGRILPLVRVADLIGGEPGAEEWTGDAGQDGEVQVAVYTVGERTIGLIVERIIDIVEELPSIEPAGSRPGILGTMVLGGRITEVLDAETLFHSLDPDVLAPPEPMLAGGGADA